MYRRAPGAAATRPLLLLVYSCPRKTLEHVLALVITIGQAIVYVLTGMYGDVGIVNGTLIVAQVSVPHGWTASLTLGRAGQG
jgi:hypothetical protein